MVEVVRIKLTLLEIGLHVNYATSMDIQLLTVDTGLMRVLDLLITSLGPKDQVEMIQLVLKASRLKKLMLHKQQPTYLIKIH